MKDVLLEPQRLRRSERAERERLEGFIVWMGHRAECNTPSRITRSPARRAQWELAGVPAVADFLVGVPRREVHQIRSDARVDQTGDLPAFVAPQLRLRSPEPIHHDAAWAATNGVPNSGSHHRRQDPAIDIALHRAALVADQLDPVSLFPRDHAAAAVYSDGGFMRNDGEDISEGVHPLSVAPTRTPRPALRPVWPKCPVIADGKPPVQVEPRKYTCR